MINKFDYRQYIKQFLKFGLVGIMNTLITLSAIFILMNAFSISYTRSNAVGYILGFVNSFILNKLWTFQSKDRNKIKKEILYFTIIFVVAYSIEFEILVYLNESLKIAGFLAQMLAAVPYTIISFILNRLITFKK